MCFGYQLQHLRSIRWTIYSRKCSASFEIKNLIWLKIQAIKWNRRTHSDRIIQSKLEEAVSTQTDLIKFTLSDEQYNVWIFITAVEINSWWISNDICRSYEAMRQPLSDNALAYVTLIHHWLLSSLWSFELTRNRFHTQRSHPLTHCVISTDEKYRWIFNRDISQR